LANPYCTIFPPELHAQLQQAQADFRLIQQRHERYRALVRELAAQARELAILSLQAAQELQTIRNHWAYALIEPDIHPKQYVKDTTDAS
jgi:multidrug resistance efflux pump